MLPAELTAYLDFARELALTAGEAILPHFRVPIEIENKVREAMGIPLLPTDAADEGNVVKLAKGKTAAKD